MKVKSFLVVLVALALLALPGCGGGASQPQPAVLTPEQAPPAVALAPTNSAATPAGPITPAPSGGNETSDGGNVSSNGGSSSGLNPAGTPADGPQTEPGGMPQTVPANPPEATAVPVDMSTWQKYTNTQYQIQLRYPPSYVVVPARPGAQPAPLASIWFQDRQLANSETANLQPPQFAIDVYDNAKGIKVDDWLKAQRIVDGNKFQQSAVQVGGVAGVKLTSMLMMAPNTFIYVAHGKYLYKITPLGPFSEGMLSSMTFQ